MKKIMRFLAWATVILATIQYFTEKVDKEGLLPEKQADSTVDKKDE